MHGMLGDITLHFFIFVSSASKSIALISLLTISLLENGKLIAVYKLLTQVQLLFQIEQPLN